MAATLALGAWAALSTETTGLAASCETVNLTRQATVDRAEMGVRLVSENVSVAKSGWRTYRNKAAGFQISYPASWSTRQQTDSSGTLTTFFVKPLHNGGVTISTFKDHGLIATQVRDIPNTHCVRVTINGVSGYRCLDTFSNHTTFVFAHAGKSYYVTALGKRFDVAILSHMVGTLRLL